ncbi:MAG: hypothetical protein ACK4NR_04920 [Micavibrio sp.]
MALETIQFAFKAATTFNLEELRQRAGEPDGNHLFQSTLEIYKAYLEAHRDGEKFVAIHPDNHAVLELDDIERLGRHKLMGIVTLTTDLESAHKMTKEFGQITTGGLLTRAFMLREQVVEAQEKGYKVGVWHTMEAKIDVFPDLIAPEQRQRALNPLLN